MTYPLVRRDVHHPDGRPFSFYGATPDATVAAFAALPAASGYDVSALHQRFDRLTRQWVLVSPSRNVRPSTTTNGGSIPDCPLCPGGAEIPGPFDLAIFENRFPALAEGSASAGRCLVVVYTGAHIEHLHELGAQGLANLVAAWRDQTATLWAEGHDYVMAFENHGAEVGATLPHLHGQIYAFGHLPPTIAVKLVAHAAHRAEHDECLGCRLVADDVASERVVDVNEHFVAAVPYANRWPLEVQIRSRAHGVGRLAQLDAAAALDLARILRAVIDRYDALWGFPLPYMMCIQEAPPQRCGSGADDWHLHIELLPPHRNAQRLKIRASVETALGVFINDTMPETVAATLRAVTPPLVDWTGLTVPSVVGV